MLSTVAIVVADPLFTALVAPAAGLLLGWLFLFLSRRLDRKNFVFQRAPKLPIHSLAVHDDAWIRGKIDTPSPLTCPHFGTPCVYYSYKIEKLVVRTTRDSRGRTRTTRHWQTIYTDSDVTPFDLVDGSGRIHVRAHLAAFKHLLSTGTDYEWLSRRHSAFMLPTHAEASVLGVRVEDGTFAPYKEIPLLVTTRTPERFLRGSDTAETWYRLVGYLAVFVGGLGAPLMYARELGRQPNWLLAILVGLGVLTPIWFVSCYNRLIRLDQQSKAAWRQIDVDLEVRNQTIPNLVAVVKGYQQHERELFERIARLRFGGSRSEKIERDAEQRVVSKALIGLAERYPELKANQLYRDLHDRLWALEEKLAASRNFYNKICQEWNDLVQGVPNVIVATIFQMSPREFFAHSVDPDAGDADARGAAARRS